MILTSCSVPIKNIGTKNYSIVAFGNSLTKGEGAHEGENFPAFLSEFIGSEVINSGISGETTRDALLRVDEDVIKFKPRMVLLEFGANDYFQNISRLETEENLEKLILKIQECGAIVVVLGIRLGIFGDEYCDVFKRVSRKTGSCYVPDILKGIMTNPSLKSDEIHPNSEGYRIMAERISKKIKPTLKKNLALSNRP